MLRFLAVFWAYAVSWVCAAFVHLADGGLNGIQSLFAPTVFVSVSLIALIVLIPVVFCCVAYFRGVWRAFFGSVCVFAIGLGAILMLLGLPVRRQFLAWFSLLRHCRWFCFAELGMKSRRPIPNSPSGNPCSWIQLKNDGYLRVPESGFK